MEIKIGAKYIRKDRRLPDFVKVLAVADNYVMCRYPRCVPFVESVKDFEKKFELLTPTTNKDI